jgi:hypothetical protein
VPFGFWACKSQVPKANINGRIGRITARRSKIDLLIPERGNLVSIESPSINDKDYRGPCGYPPEDRIQFDPLTLTAAPQYLESGHKR